MPKKASLSAERMVPVVAQLHHAFAAVFMSIQGVLERWVDGPVLNSFLRDGLDALERDTLFAMVVLQEPVRCAPAVLDACRAAAIESAQRLSVYLGTLAPHRDILAARDAIARLIERFQGAPSTAAAEFRN